MVKLPQLPRSLTWKSYDKEPTNILADAYQLGSDYNYGQNILNEYGYIAYPNGLIDDENDDKHDDENTDAHNNITTKLTDIKTDKYVNIWSVDGHHLYTGLLSEAKLKHGIYIIKQANQSIIIHM